MLDGEFSYMRYREPHRILIYVVLYLMNMFSVMQLLDLFIFEQL